MDTLKLLDPTRILKAVAINPFTGNGFWWFKIIKNTRYLKYSTFGIKKLPLRGDTI
jgi:hypothetical protein